MHNHHIKLTIATYALLLIASPLIWASGASAASQNCPVGYVCTPVSNSGASITMVNPNIVGGPASLAITGTGLNDASEAVFYDAAGFLRGRLNVTSATQKRVTVDLTDPFLSTLSSGTYGLGLFSSKCKSNCTSNLVPFTIKAKAQANISLSPNSPLVATIPVSDATNGQYLGLPVLVFDVNAQNDTIHLRNVTVRIYDSAGGTGSVGAAYLYQGSTLVASASVSNDTATFSNIANGTAGATIPVDTTVSYIVKVDVTGITSGTLALTAGVATSSVSDLTILSSSDGAAIVAGSALGNTQTVAGVGPLFTLVGTPTITKSSVSTGNPSDIAYQYSATFNVSIQAIGQNVIIGLPASTTGASFGNMNTGPVNAQLYQNGAASTTPISGGLRASYSQPSNTTFASNSFTVSRNQRVTVPVTYSFVVTNSPVNAYAIQMQGIYTNGSALTSFMANQPVWRTSSI